MQDIVEHHYMWGLRVWEVGESRAREQNKWFHPISFSSLGFCRIGILLLASCQVFETAR
ncbi:MAG: hypothetical protein WA782_03580 [Sulfitobacter sp.]